jgi:hypothetical protein
MKLPPLRKPATVIIAAFLASSAGLAQEAPKAPIEPLKAPIKEEIIEFAPFEVKALRDEGYRASSTLAGSRLNTNLKDVAASVAVLTSEFLDDLGATNIETAFAYIAGVETALNTDTSERGSSGELQDSNINTSPGGNRVRGLASADVTRDFFEVGSGNLDRYNVERIELVRGPNSILFGLGSPAGIINYTTKKPRFGRDSAETSVQLDSYGSYRATLDLNRELIKNALAIRIMALKADTKSMFATSFDKDERLTAAFQLQPFRGTTLRYSHERVSINARRPNYSVPIDNISHWMAQGRPIWDIRNPANRGKFPADNFPGGPNPNPLSGSPTTLNGGVEEFNSPFPYTNVQFFLPGTSDPTVPFITTKTAVGYRTGAEVNTVDGNTTLSLARSRSAFDQVSNFINTSFSDASLFPIYDINLAALPGNSQISHSNVHHVSLTQRLLSNLQFELAGFHDTTTNANTSRFDGADRAVSIDLNPVLLDGVTVNPGYLRPFISGRGGYRETERTNQAVRATLAYDLNFANVSSRLGFLGRYLFSAVAHRSRTDNYSASGSPSSVITTDSDTFGVNKTIYGHWVFQNWYLGDPFTAGQQTPNYTTFTTQEIDPSVPITVYRTTNGASPAAPLIWSNAAPVATGKLFSDASWAEFDVEGVGVTWQAYLWKDRIAATYGVREDTVSSYSTNQARDPITNLADPANPKVWGRALAAPGPDQTGRTSTKGLVFHPFKFLSLFYNESDNFSISPTRVYATLEPIPNSSGTGKDFGVVLRTPGEKIEVKLNHFKTSQKNVSGRGSLASTARFGVNTYERYVRATLTNFRNNRINQGTFNNGGTYTFRGQQMDRATFENFFAYRWYDPAATDKLGPPTELGYAAPANSDDTVDVDASGYEIELTYNPLPNWRIAFNATSVETIQTNIAPGFEEFVNARLPIWSKTWGDLQLDSNGNIIGASNGLRFQDRTTQPLMYTEYITQVVAARNTAKLAEGRVNVGQAKYAASLITNYSFRTGKLRGVSVGANMRWREGSALGYPIIDGPNGPVTDLANPYIGPDDFNLGVNASYRRKIFKDKVTWITRFQVNNLWGDDDVELSAINPDGTPAAYRVGREMFFQWSNTFQF